MAERRGPSLVGTIVFKCGHCGVMQNVALRHGLLWDDAIEHLAEELGERTRRQPGAASASTGIGLSTTLVDPNPIDVPSVSSDEVPVANVVAAVPGVQIDESQRPCVPGSGEGVASAVNDDTAALADGVGRGALADGGETGGSDVVAEGGDGGALAVGDESGARDDVGDGVVGEALGEGGGSGEEGVAKDGGEGGESETEEAIVSEEEDPDVPVRKRVCLLHGRQMLDDDQR